MTPDNIWAEYGEFNTFILTRYNKLLVHRCKIGCKRVSHEKIWAIKTNKWADSRFDMGLCGRSGVLHGIDYCCFWDHLFGVKSFKRKLRSLLKHKVINENQILKSPKISLEEHITVGEYLKRTTKVNSNPDDLLKWDLAEQMHLAGNNIKRAIMKMVGAGSSRRSHQYKINALKLGVYYGSGD